ncbi:hypothetical protein KY343_04545 [Candidatus Woesearchaeota archaeon]|nr:hypothetical protein [Candidatus Woesearchaeota archaeon]
MANEKVRIIEELARILNGYNAANSFLQIMFVYKKVKTGFFVQGEENKEVRAVFRQIIPLVKNLGLYVSSKHGGYITHDYSLYKSWNGSGFYFKKTNLGSFYLGYPECCETQFIMAPDLIGFSIYYTLKRVLIDRDKEAAAKFDMLFKDLMEVEEYHPCVVGCPETHKRAEVFKGIRKEFSSFIPSDYMVKQKEAVRNIILDILRTVNFRNVQRRFKKNLPLLKKRNLSELFSLTDDFFKEIEELLANPQAKKKLLAKEEAFILEI